MFDIVVNGLVLNVTLVSCKCTTVADSAGRVQRIQAGYGVMEETWFMSPLSKPSRKDSIRLASANTMT